MYHYALGVEYDGSEFHGFQRQEGQRTIQESLEVALSQVAASEVEISPAGRTDAGVHATQQVVSMSCSSQRAESAWVRGTNRYLCEEVAIVWAKPVPSSFHSRHSALWRRYLYVFGDQSKQQVFSRKFATWVPDELNTRAMNSAAKLFCGDHDFSSVRASNCTSRTPQRYVYHSVIKSLNGLVVFDIVANAFLLHMVRNIASILLEVGKGKWSVDQVFELLQAKDRTLAPATAPSQGLYLVAIGYEPEFGLSSAVRVPAILAADQESFEPVSLPHDYFKKQVDS